MLLIKIKLTKYLISKLEDFINGREDSKKSINFLGD